MLKKLFPLICILLLTGCAQSDVSREVVSDQMPEVIETWNTGSYEVIFGVPDQAVMTYADERETCYLLNDGELEVYGLKFLSSDKNAAVRYLSGFDTARLQVLETTRFSLPEYRFCWTAQSEEGNRLYSADVVIDDIYSYAIVCSTAEDAGNKYMEQVKNVFSSFGLFFNEGV